MSRLLILTCLQRKHAGIYDYHSHMDEQDHFSDIEYDIFELDQQTPGVKQSKQFLLSKRQDIATMIALISAIRVLVTEKVLFSVSPFFHMLLIPVVSHKSIFGSLSRREHRFSSRAALRDVKSADAGLRSS
jgi:hypothetical protein